MSTDKAPSVMRDAILTVTTATDGTTLIVRLAGELDLGNTGLLRDAILAGTDEGTHTEILVDLGSLSFIDSSGIAALVHAEKEAEIRDLRLRIRPGPPEVQRAIELCGLLDQLPFIP